MKEIKLTPNNRYLFNYVGDILTIVEAALIEISPSGKYYKFKTLRGDTLWLASITIKFLENLGPVLNQSINESLPDSDTTPTLKASHMDDFIKKFETDPPGTLH